MRQQYGQATEQDPHLDCPVASGEVQGECTVTQPPRKSTTIECRPAGRASLAPPCIGCHPIRTWEEKVSRQAAVAGQRAVNSWLGMALQVEASMAACSHP